MKVYITGIDGYLGWTFSKYMREKGHEVYGCDNFFRRNVANSLVPLVREGGKGVIKQLDVSDIVALTREFFVVKPDVVVHLGEIPSAPYSMMHNGMTMHTMSNNILGSLSVLLAMKKSCPEAHLIKLGSMGEYIPSSWYHMTKVIDNKNSEYMNELTGLRITNVRQGPVYGVGGRFDYDEIWGTVINRWITMGVAGHDILLYGDGRQVRGFLPIQDSMSCLEIIANNPPTEIGVVQVNQYASKYELLTLANMVADLTGVKVRSIDNPRKEKLSYEGAGDNSWLISKGYKPTLNTMAVMRELMESIKPYRLNIDKEKFIPKVRWNNGP